MLDIYIYIYICVCVYIFVFYFFKEKLFDSVVCYK